MPVKKKSPKKLLSLLCSAPYSWQARQEQKSMHGPSSVKHSGQTKWPSASIIKEEKGNWLSGHNLLLKEQLRHEKDPDNKASK